MPTVKGKVENGVVRPLAELPVPEGGEVEIVFDSRQPPAPQGVRDLLESMKRGIDFGGWKWRGRDEIYDRQRPR